MSPDVEIKSFPDKFKIRPKISYSKFYLKAAFFKIAQQVGQILGLLL